MRIHVGDGITAIEAVLFSGDELFTGCDVPAAGELESVSQFSILTRLDPTLLLKWTVGGSTNFDLYFRLYDEPGIGGVAVEDVPIATGLTSAADAGIAIPVREAGSLYNTIYPVVRLVLKNNDAVNLLHIVSSALIQVYG